MPDDRRTAPLHAPRFRPTRRLVAALALSASVAAVTACGSDSNSGTGPPPPPAVTGTYALVSVGGNALPTTATGSDNQPTYFMNGKLVLTSNNTFADTVTVQRPQGAATTQGGIEGTYTVSGSTVHFVKAGGGTSFDAQYNSGNITFVDPLSQLTFVFTK